MRKVLRVGKDVKARRSRVKELMDLILSALEMDMKLQLIQELIALGLMHVAEVLTEEGRKVLLGFIQAGTENASVCKDFLNNLPLIEVSTEKKVCSALWMVAKG